MVVDQTSYRVTPTWDWIELGCKLGWVVTTNVNKKQMSTKNKCQQKTNINQKQISTKNTQLNPTEPNITQTNSTQLNPMVVTLK